MIRSLKVDRPLDVASLSADRVALAAIAVTTSTTAAAQQRHRRLTSPPAPQATQTPAASHATRRTTASAITAARLQPSRTSCCRRGCASAASSASASKASRTSTSSTDATMPTGSAAFRFNAAVTPSKQLAFQVQVQDARVGREEGGADRPRRSRRRSICARRSPTSATPRRRSRFALGRQELVFGESAARRLAALGEHRPHAGRRAGHPPRADVSGRRVRRVGRAHPAGRVRQERQRQSLRRRLRHVDQAACPQATVEPYVFWRRDVNLRSELGAARHALQQTTVGTRIAGQLPAQSRLRRRDGAAARRPRPATRSAPGPGTGSCDVAAGMGGAEAHRRNTTTRPATTIPTDGTRQPSISSTPPATTSSASPIRSAGGTSTTCARASSSRRSRRRRSR